MPVSPYLLPPKAASGLARQSKRERAADVVRDLDVRFYRGGRWRGPFSRSARSLRGPAPNR